MTNRTEFYEVAVRAGFYGRDHGGLFGKKDNARKYWEDMCIKLCLRPVLEELVAKGRRLRVVDLGCGSGEGFELLTHVPARPEPPTRDQDFLIAPSDLSLYVGLDLSEGMVIQGRENLSAHENVRFGRADLREGWTLSREPPFDLYFSSYGSLSHLSPEELARLFGEICAHVEGSAYFVFDVLGRFSPEWPKYWAVPEAKMLPYNMAYLLQPQDRIADHIEWFPCCYWTPPEIERTLREAARAAGVELTEVRMWDRSLFVGRHMDTGILNSSPRAWRYQVNRLLDHGYRGQVDQLEIDLGFLAPHQGASPEAWERLQGYASGWNAVVRLLGALMAGRDSEVRAAIEGAPPALSEDMKMLAWLSRNQSRFPVADSWSSVVGPQVAVVLRNLELSQPSPVGCGHALFGIVRIDKGATANTAGLGAAGVPVFPIW